MPEPATPDPVTPEPAALDGHPGAPADALRLHDTFSGRMQVVPPGPVRLYVCGVTPYDTTHVGHAFTFVQYDMLTRALRWLGHEVTYVQNVTDVDESLIQRARETGTDWRSLGDRETARLVRDLRALRAEPDHLVPATSCMGTIRDLVATLIERGAAYVVEGGSVFFRVRAVPDYGALSRLSRDEMFAISAAQDDADVDDPRKEDALDFALWRGATGAPDEPWWEAPWGRGRPGWHIECSAVNLRYHGPQVTVHGGGVDLVYPHHESEIVQSESATGVRPFARIWSHTAMTRLEGKKMSKSLGNLVYVSDLLVRHEPDALRLALLGHHYREAFEWSDDELVRASARLDALRLAAAGPDRDDGAETALRAALTNDLDMPAALAALERAGGRELTRLGAILGLRIGP